MNLEANVSVTATPEEMTTLFAALRLVESDTLNIDGQNVTVDGIAQAISAMLNQQGGCTSLDATITINGEEVEADLADVASLDAYRQVEDAAHIEAVMDTAGLTDNQRGIVALYYGLYGHDQHSLSEIAAIKGVNKKAIHNTLERARARMRTA